MPVVVCPTCGERGKIPPTLVGMRIKCKKCGVAFNVAMSSSKAPAPHGAEAAVAASAAAAQPATASDGIVVEGLDASAWSLAGDASSDLLKPVTGTERTAGESSEISAFHQHDSASGREYKIICSRDKIFEGKFDLPRLEEVLNHHARQGWVVKGMSTPHLKGFGEGTKEELVILLEREHVPAATVTAT